MRVPLLIATALFVMMCTPLPAAGVGPTAAEVQVLRGRALLQEAKREVEGRIELVSGLIRRARETGSSRFYTEAQQELDPLLRAEPKHFEGRKLQAGIWIGLERWKEAHELAAALQREVPDDIPAYGVLADTLLALGRYDEATKATQWMFDLRPPGPLAYERGVKVRAAYGDFAGAIDFAMQATRLLAPEQTSEKAEWVARLSLLELASGRVPFAESYARQALALQADHIAGLEAMGRVLVAQGKATEAREIWKRAHEVSGDVRFKVLGGGEVSGVQARSVQWALAQRLAQRPQGRRRAIELLNQLAVDGPTAEVLVLRSTLLRKAGRAESTKADLEKVKAMGVDVGSLERALATGGLPIR